MAQCRAMNGARTSFCSGVGIGVLAPALTVPIRSQVGNLLTGVEQFPHRELLPCHYRVANVLVDWATSSVG